MKLGIVGTGKIVQELLPHIGSLALESVYLLSTERSRERSMGLKEKYGLTGVYFSFEELLASDIDTVYIALPNYLHFEFSKRAMEAGKHVICEKPITSNLRELNALNALAREKNLMLFEAMSIYYMPAFKRMRDDLEKIGQVKIVSLNFSQYSSRYDDFQKGIIQPVFDPEKSGGTLLDLNVYNVHALVGLFGEPESVSYFANTEHGIDTSGVLLCSYPDFQAVSVGAKDCAAPNLCLIQGVKGTICANNTVNYMTGYEIRYNDGRDGERYECVGQEYRLLYELRTFKNAIETGDVGIFEELMGYSLTAAKILETARLQANVKFPCDK